LALDCQRSNCYILIADGGGYRVASMIFPDISLFDEIRALFGRIISLFGGQGI
jgi:hypothetical protein